eukprot:559417-Hanusia_phi.AAC.1
MQITEKSAESEMRITEAIRDVALTLDILFKLSSLETHHRHGLVQLQTTVNQHLNTLTPCYPTSPSLILSRFCPTLQPVPI